MAILKISTVMLPQRQTGVITTSATADAVPNNGIAIYRGNTVPVYRQLEIINAFHWLWEGIRSRRIMQQFAGIVYSGCSIYRLGENQRQTISTLVSFGANDVFIGIGALTCTTFKDAVEMLNASFDDLIQSAQELMKRT